MVKKNRYTLQITTDCDIAGMIVVEAHSSKEAIDELDNMLGGAGPTDIGIVFNGTYTEEQINEAMMGYEVSALRHRTGF